MRYGWLLLCLGVAGCGPLAAPMVIRLSPEQQAEADRAWENMMTPPDRLDRLTLLDVLLESQLYQVGVDRLYLRSEKQVGRNRVLMEVKFDRRTPDRDLFRVRVVDGWGLELRRIEYSHDEVRMRLEELHREESERRRERLQPATQPEGWVPPASAMPAESVHPESPAEE